MNQMLNQIKSRRSVRQYESRPVPPAVLERILEAGTYAASAMNRQSAIMVAVTDPAVRERLRVMNASVMGRTDIDPFYGAPVVVVVLADRSNPCHIYDGSLVMGNLMLAAHAEGLGSCWIHRAREVFDSPEGKELLRLWGIQGDYEGIGHCILGYPAGELPPEKPRKKDYVYHV